jgi:hypothetical protein
METVAFAAVHADGPANGALLTISSNATMIENLPVDIMVRISMFLKLPCRIRFASAASKPLLELIFQDCHPLCHEINFCALPYTENALEPSNPSECEISHSSHQSGRL